MEEKKKGFFSRLVEGLTKTRENIVSGMDSIFSGFSAIDDDFYEELEETLIMGDMGIQTTMAVIEVKISHPSSYSNGWIFGYDFFSSSQSFSGSAARSSVSCK